MFNSAGMERVVSNKALYFSERGHNVTIITANQNGRPYFYSVPESVNKIDLSLNSFEYDGKPIFVKIFSFLKKEKVFKQKLDSFLKENPQDIVVTLEDKFIPLLVQLSPPGTILIGESHFNGMAFKELGKSVGRGFLQTIIYNLRAWYVQHRYYGKLDAYALLTKEDLELRTGTKSNFVVLPNSISYIESKRAKLENPIVIAVGRLSYQKGFERLLESWKIVHEKCPEWKLHIYGDGEDKQKFMNICFENSLEDSVLFFPPTHQIEERILESSIYVMTSRFEGFPMVLLEAMSLGLPLISFNCKTGPKDIINDGYNGFLVQEGDTATFAYKIIDLIQDINLRQVMGANSKQESKKYSHENIAQKWESLFKTLIERKK
jgi:glycosyltransferase involved in cell wall biosynthesis